MPRIPPSLFWKARFISPQGPVLLPVCRDLASVANELRWIREHIQRNPSMIPPFWRFWKLCEKRGKGIPLQYVLGTQPFGDLEIKCRPDVLIPRRPETESYTVYLANKLIRQRRLASPDDSQTFGILDFCTGSGCIALQMYAQLRKALPSVPIDVLGVDVSPAAVSLARENLAYNGVLGSLALPATSGAQPDTSIRFELGDLFSPSLLTMLRNTGHSYDVMVSNPPYISKRGFARDTARAVRNWEPRLALVPVEHLGQRYTATGCEPEDIFYARLLDIATILKPRTMLFEVAGSGQAIRVVRMAVSALSMGGRDSKGPIIEVWRDNPYPEVEPLDVGHETIKIRGTGHARSVYISYDQHNRDNS
ncbi:S-adenosyl-L-methionine-dependent methyltransferase [Thozetella sp. PMI_491]|nr:S-adenosyl-L-methionine-dependent methyltransferase [Thozetella sp. PMI_491]